MKILRMTFILGFAAAALYHLFLAFIPKMGDAATGERHLVFVVVNFVAFIIMILNHPKGLLLLIPLILQQFYSHGRSIWEQWGQFGEVDWQSVLILLAIPMLSFYILKSFGQCRNSRPMRG